MPASGVSLPPPKRARPLYTDIITAPEMQTTVPTTFAIPSRLLKFTSSNPSAAASKKVATGIMFCDTAAIKGVVY